MRKFFLIGGMLIVGIGAVLYALTLPAVMEKNFEWTCGTLTERCIVRMRGMGHVYSYKGDLERAEHWYLRGAGAGDVAAMFHLGWTLEQKGLAQIKEAIQSMATETQSNSSGARLANVHFEQAATWYRRAADKNFAPAMNNLGSLYEQGLTGNRNPYEAVRWYTSAARAGNPVGAFNLSLAYRQGNGVTQDLSAADKWAEWSPTQYNETDLSEPTLQRTQMFGSAIPAPLRARLQAVADSGPPAFTRLELSPLKPDPNLPTFSQVRERLDRQQR